ncbi:MAG TPA: PBP1A family penicillin-binding protein [Caulobacteraceae bacterium]|nr:PBP1A family penicillin-binding protein [Caulobacteraceae bacterium]
MIALFAAAFSFGLAAPEIPKLPPITRAAQITYVDASGDVIGVRGGQFAPPVDVNRLPSYVPAAFVAIEDRRFYDHEGFDPVGMARAIVKDVTQGKREGASTITQQLARNLFLTNDQTVQRKATELIYAVQLEQAFSKKQILGLYLSRVNFGGGAWGLEAAARRYFDKPASRLTLKEAAMLAAIMKSPTNYNPAAHPAENLARANLVLDAMVETGVVNAGQAARAKAEKPKVYKTSPDAPAQYFVDWVDAQTRAVVGPVKQDLVVETTLDSAMETAAASSAQATVAKFAKQKASQAAVIAVDGVGRVKVMVGGIDYASAPYNRAALAHRQAGSAWKPFVYLTALEAGRTPDVMVVDEPVTIGTWSPQNYEPGFLGPITLQTAFAQSINTVAARLADEVGRDNVASTARRLGIASPVNTDPAMALGTTLVTPLEMAQAYAAFANGGDRVSAYGVERIKTAGGQVIWTRPASQPVPAISNPALTELQQLMRAVVTSGTGTRAAVPGYDIAGKTGTTSDYKDAWFCGVTGGLSAVVWMGRDDNSPMDRITGGIAPAEAWRGFMTSALKRIGNRPIPPGRPPALPVAQLQPAIY